MAYFAGWVHLWRVPIWLVGEIDFVAFEICADFGECDFRLEAG